MENKNKNTATKIQKEVFTEPTCELVQFSFENILAAFDSSGVIVGPEDPLDY